MVSPGRFHWNDRVLHSDQAFQQFLKLGPWKELSSYGVYNVYLTADTIFLVLRFSLSWFLCSQNAMKPRVPSGELEIILSNILRTPSCVDLYGISIFNRCRRICFEEMFEYFLINKMIMICVCLNILLSLIPSITYSLNIYGILAQMKN